MTLTVGSLFSGIGGLDLGLERAGMNVIWQSEIDPYACRVLSKHWPEVPNHGDIKTINWGDVVRPDVICGGYPCQPFSTAGKRKGEQDPRHLWPWVRDAISELRPRYAILENVRGHLSLGGLTVIGELASIGYDAEWRVVSAASVGANHRRDRVIIVAYSKELHSNGSNNYSRVGTQPETVSKLGDDSRKTNLADSGGERCVDSEFGIKSNKRRLDALSIAKQSSANVAYTDSVSVDDSNLNGCHTETLTKSRTVFPVVGRSSDIGTGKHWFSEPNVGRVANGIPNRVDRLRGLGNAVVPQVAEVIGRLVISHAQHN